MSAIALDPLIAEAKERARRRRLLALAAAVVVAVVVGSVLRSLTATTGNSGLASFRQATVDSFGSSGGVTWADTEAGNFAMKLWLTSNDGQTWRSVRLPSHITAVNVEQIQFADRRHGWFVADDPPGNYPLNMYGQVFRTTDGGLTWSRSVPPGCHPGCGYASTRFRTPEHGYLLDGPPWGSGRLYVTADGGATWRLLSRPSLPYGQLSFSTRRIGFAVTGKTVQDAGLSRTVDGGRTWKPVALVPGDLTFATNGLTDMPWIRGSDLVVGTVRYLHGGRERRLVVNVSSDRGATWRARVTPWLFSGDPTLDVLTARRWIVTGPGEAQRGRSYLTTNAGRSWSRFRGALERTELGLSGTRDAWAVHGTTLVRTTDGGAYWRAAGPRVPRRRPKRQP